MTIAGSDPSGGAGIQADLKTFTNLRCYGQAVITALTVQNTLGVQRSVAVDSDLVYHQIEAVMQDFKPDAVKIGMLPDANIVKRVAESIRVFRPAFVVLDPVMVSSSGLKLVDDRAVQALCEHLIPLCTLITPNLPESKVLTRIETNDCVALAKVMGDIYQDVAILVKGGHREGRPVDVLYNKGKIKIYDNAPRIETRNTHGTGCVLSSGIAAFVAQGMSLPEAVEHAKDYLTEALHKGASYKAGGGHGPMYLLP